MARAPAATKHLSDRDLFDAQKRTTIIEEIEAIGEIRLRFAQDRLKKAVETFSEGAFAYLDLISELESGVRRIGHAPELQKLLERARTVQIALHADEAMPARDEGAATPPVDEADLPLDVVVPLKKPRRASAIIKQPPKTLAATKFTPELAAEYVKFFRGADFNADKRHLVVRAAKAATSNRARYETVGNRLAIPWWFIAGVHMLESTFNFGAHLHNGDPLSRRTRRVPPGRPKTGAPPFTWEESAADALEGLGLAGLKDWSLARALHRFERYNGMGYRRRKLPSPYLWSFSTLYRAGKFVADGKFSATAVSAQCGAAVLLKHLEERGDVLLDLDAEEEGTAFDVSEDIETARTDPTPDLGDSPFARFWAEHLSDVLHFKPREFLFKGASHARNGLNTDPPPELWPNIVPLVRVIDQVRKDLGKPVKLLSVYRSPAYNAAVGGAKSSLHKRFMAADFTVLEGGADVATWAKAVDRLRDRKMFAGGIGLYRSRRFVHVDVRGHNANWTQ